MCVIAVCREHRPTTVEVEAMFKANSWGAGIAWRKTEGKETRVHWMKGLTLEEITQASQNMSLPYVLHFRIPSVGGSEAALCHPFPITREAPLILRGSIKGAVLFHNGTWNRYRSFLEDACMKGAGKVHAPRGLLSDTRVMAWAAAHYGTGILNLLEEKIVVFPAEGEIELFWDQRASYDTAKFTFYDNRFWVSNMGWSHRTIASTEPGFFRGRGHEGRWDVETKTWIPTTHPQRGRGSLVDDRLPTTYRPVTNGENGESSGPIVVDPATGLPKEDAALIDGNKAALGVQSTTPPFRHQGGAGPGGSDGVEEGGVPEQGITKVLSTLSEEDAQGLAAALGEADPLPESSDGGALDRTAPVGALALPAGSMSSIEIKRWACSLNSKPDRLIPRMLRDHVHKAN